MLASFSFNYDDLITLIKDHIHNKHCIHVNEKDISELEGIDIDVFKIVLKRHL